MEQTDGLTCSQKRYLLAIYQLYLQKRAVKTTEIAQMVGVSKSSVTCMTGRLSEHGFLQKSYYGQIELTENGLYSAKIIYQQVRIFYSFLIGKFSEDKKQAWADAVAMVVYASEPTVQNMTAYLQHRLKG